MIFSLVRTDMGRNAETRTGLVHELVQQASGSECLFGESAI